MLLTRLRLGFAHVNDHRFRHSFENYINPSCSFSFSQYCFDLVNSVKSGHDAFESLSDNDKKDILLNGDDSCLDNSKNKFILKATFRLKIVKDSLDLCLNKGYFY